MVAAARRCCCEGEGEGGGEQGEGEGASSAAAVAGAGGVLEQWAVVKVICWQHVWQRVEEAFDLVRYHWSHLYTRFRKCVSQTLDTNSNLGVNDE
jgi:hypothetical protein